MKWIAFFFALTLISCSGAKAPKQLYIADWSSLSSFEQEQVSLALELLNEGAGENFIGFSGNRPLILKAETLPGTRLGKSEPQTFKCEIIIDSANDIIRDEPRLIQYIFIHQLGHCYGLPYEPNNPDSVMFTTLPGVWDIDVENQLKDFAVILKNLSK